MKSYRTRVELGIYHEKGQVFYASFEGKKKVIITKLDMADEKIQKLMPSLLEALNQSLNLKEKLFGAEFLASKKDLSLTLLYHKDITLIQHDLELLSQSLKLKLIARSKGKKLVFGGEILEQELDIEGQTFYYHFNNECFIQPNTYINEKMISWVLSKLETKTRADLLELYCGYGNFTLALAKLFKKVCASEISKQNIAFARQNCELNNINNISFLRMSAEDFSSAYHKEREFNRLKEQNLNLDDFNFTHILIDPPRAGLDEKSLELVKEFENIIYISCNPLSLRANLNMLCKTHEIEHFAIFDQFPNTPHLECGAILKRKG